MKYRSRIPFGFAAVTGLALLWGCPSAGGGGDEGEEEDLCVDIECAADEECDPDTGECEPSDTGEVEVEGEGEDGGTPAPASVGGEMKIASFTVPAGQSTTVTPHPGDHAAAPRGIKFPISG